MKTEPDYSYLGEPTTAMKLRQWSTAGLLFTYGVLFIVVFALYSASDDNTNSSSETGAVGIFQSAASIAAAQVGFAASLSTSGALQLGGGTSVYKNLYQLAGVCAKSTIMQPLFDSSYLLSFVDGVKGAGSGRESHDIIYLFR
jgi:hypothetical protein